MWFSKPRVYLDHASAPPTLSEASAAMREAEKIFGNPGAIHAEGVAAKKSLEDSRARVAQIVGCKARQLIFTSGLTESNNLAIVGYARHIDIVSRYGLSQTHWIVSSIEHDSVLASFAEVERLGGVITYLDPDERGIITPAAVERVLRPETVFLSIGWANNEIGTVQPLAKIAKVLNAYSSKYRCTKPIFHADAGQAPLYLSTVAHSLGVDLLSLGANKLYGPHGIGALYLSSDVVLSPLSVGGKQERALRAGTESVALAAGFAAAFEVVASEREKESKRLKALRDELEGELVARIPGVVINGSTSLTAGGLDHVLPHMLNISIPKIQSEYVTLALDAAGIAVSTKSACREGEESRSHVVAALGGPALSPERAGWRASNTLRFSLGRDTRQRDIYRVVKELVRIVSK